MSHRLVETNDLSRVHHGVGLMGEMAAADYWEEQGAITRSHYLLLLLGRKRFGAPDPSIETAMMAITDLDRLMRISVAILTAKNWSELLATT